MIYHFQLFVSYCVSFACITSIRLACCLFFSVSFRNWYANFWFYPFTYRKYFSSSSCLRLHNYSSFILSYNYLTFLSPIVLSPGFLNLPPVFITLSNRLKLYISSLENTPYFLVSSSLVSATTPNSCLSLLSHLSTTPSS